ncbi:hypothetical protein ACN28S_15745 [Cystobacter fuscus]
MRLGGFPVDLTELSFAARALRRHLMGRAWASEALEVSGLDALEQVARRPAPGPWRFIVRRKGRGLEVLTAAASVLDALAALERAPRPAREVPVQRLADAGVLGLLRWG